MVLFMKSGHEVNDGAASRALELAAARTLVERTTT